MKQEYKYWIFIEEACGRIQVLDCNGNCGVEYKYVS